MRGWSSILVGSGLLAPAARAYLTGGFNGAALTFLTAGAFLIYRGCRGIGITAAGDPTALADFVSNPAGALVDAATDQAEEWLTEKRKPSVDEPSEFDAEAAFARYMANRPVCQPAAAEASPPMRRFGRKGLQP